MNCKLKYNGEYMRFKFEGTPKEFLALIKEIKA